MTELQTVKADYPPLPQPEPGLTPEALVDRAAALRPLLRAEQDEADWCGHYSDKVHKALLEGGFYRILQPKLFGGYEFDPKAFIRCVLELSRGHPGAGWCFTLGASHGYILAAHWPAAVQRELFGPDGEFRSPAVGVPGGNMTPTPGGYRITGTWPFASGVPYATHFIATAIASDEDGAPRRVMFVTPIDTVEIQSDWGKDQYFGMQASGSNTVKLNDVFVPERYVIEAKFDSATDAMAGGTPGTRLHGNAMYLAIPAGWFNTEFAAILSGTARAALDEFHDMALTKGQTLNPRAKLCEDPFIQNAYATALGLADSAEALTLTCADLYMQQLEGYFSDRIPVTTKDSLKVWGMASQAARMACEAVEILWRHAGGSTGRRGRRLQRYFRDIETYRLHPQAQPNFPAMRAQLEFGMNVSLFGQQTRGKPG